MLTPATILPIVVMALIFGLIGNVFGGFEETLQEKPVIGVINEDNGTFSMIATSVLNATAKIVFNSSNTTDKQKGMNQLKHDEGIALIIIPHNFTQRIQNGLPGEIEVNWIMKGAGLMGSISSNIADRILSMVNINISQTLIQRNTSVNATTFLTPLHRKETTYFKGKEIVEASPDTVTGMLSSQSTFIPIVMMPDYSHGRKYGNIISWLWRKKTKPWKHCSLCL